MSQEPACPVVCATTRPPCPANLSSVIGCSNAASPCSTSRAASGRAGYPSPSPPRLLEADRSMTGMRHLLSGSCWWTEKWTSPTSRTAWASSSRQRGATHGREELLGIVEAWKPKLLVLDNLSTLAKQ